MHKQAKTNDKNQFAEFAFLNFPYLRNGVSKATKLRCFFFLCFFSLIFACLCVIFEHRRYMPDVRANSETTLKELFDSIIGSLE